MTTDAATPLEEVVREYLLEKRCTLWQTFNLQTPSGRGLDEAVDFVVDLVDEMNRRVVGEVFPRKADDG